MTYRESKFTESQQQARTDGKTPEGPTLAEMESIPAVAEALLCVRAMRTREQWAEIASGMGDFYRWQPQIRHVLKVMPGDCCMMDAARLIARAHTA